jgi:hypothetical protein
LLVSTCFIYVLLTVAFFLLWFQFSIDLKLFGFFTLRLLFCFTWLLLNLWQDHHQPPKSFYALISHLLLICQRFLSGFATTEFRANSVVFVFNFPTPRVIFSFILKVLDQVDFVFLLRHLILLIQVVVIIQLVYLDVTFVLLLFFHESIWLL